MDTDRLASTLGKHQLCVLQSMTTAQCRSRRLLHLTGALWPRGHSHENWYGCSPAVVRRQIQLFCSTTRVLASHPPARPGDGELVLVADSQGVGGKLPPSLPALLMGSLAPCQIIFSCVYPRFFAYFLCLSQILCLFKWNFLHLCIF